MAAVNRGAEKIVEKIFDQLVPGRETNISCYSEFANEYDQGLCGINYATPRLCAEMALRHLATGESDLQALDICVGTGLASEALLAQGYYGAVDGIDGNKRMLKVAEGKKIFRQLLRHIVTPDTKLPVPDNTYDIAVCSGSFSPGHIRPECIPDFFRVLKGGGVLAFNTTNFSSCDDAVQDSAMDKAAVVLKTLVNDGVCMLMEEEVRDGYDVSTSFKFYNGRKDKIHSYKKL